MNEDKVIKLPRLYVDQELQPGTKVSFAPEQAHYLRNVLRRTPGDMVRIFNGRQGEWIVSLTELGKKSAEGALEQQWRPQPEQQPAIHLYFAPIKKARQDWLVEKAVELGATHLHPVITQNTEVRRVNEERMRQQILEAAEQCERMDVPVLEDMVSLADVLKNLDDLTLLACLERDKAARLLGAAISEVPGAIGFLIGPEGGFTQEENVLISAASGVIPVSLGETVLRCETASTMTLAVLKVIRDMP